MGDSRIATTSSRCSSPRITRCSSGRERPAIFLFSNYIWNFERNLKLSALLKEANPSNLTIHGGPSTPKYKQDCEDFFVANPHVDITVRGEGEATFAAILDALDPDDLGDLSTPARCRRAELPRRRTASSTPTIANASPTSTRIPSPYLLGLFEPFGRAHVARGHGVESRLSVRLHLLRLGIGDALPHPQVRHGSRQGRARVVLEERVAVRLARAMRTSASSSATSRSPSTSPR